MLLEVALHGLQPENTVLIVDQETLDNLSFWF